MSNNAGLNERGNHQGHFTQGVGGWAEYTVSMTETSDTVRHDVTLPPGKIIPVIFLPGVMGSNLRLSTKRMDELRLSDNRSWRPDDMVGWGNEANLALLDKGIGGWYKNASPAQRQLVLDPNETEVEYYHYTESNERFDPEGKETVAADERHQNVPNDLEAIPPLLGLRPNLNKQNASRSVSRKSASAAQIARWRGWSEVLFAGAYGELLKTLENHLNVMTSPIRTFIPWARFYVDPRSFGATKPMPRLTTEELEKVAKCWYPVHAMGYNFLKSNGDSAKVIAERIRGLVKGYQKRGFKCDEVIVVTHSMGGLLGRALLHPKYGNMLHDPTVKILGMYDNVMPTTGAAASYKRMRFGFLEGSSPAAKIRAKILGINGQHATAILANAPAALELLPGSAYGNTWLRVVDGLGREIWSLPNASADALQSIYTQPPECWWRLINPAWVNPGNVAANDGGGIKAVIRRLQDASAFVEDIKNTFHPTSSYGSFCSSDDRLSYAEITFKIIDPDLNDSRTYRLPNAESWKLLNDDAQGTLRVNTGQRVITLVLQPPAAPGDETVPAARSAQKMAGTLFVHNEKNAKSYEHQGSYADSSVLASLLYAIVQIAKTAKWG